MMPIEIVPIVKKDAPEVKRGEKPKAVNKIPKKEKGKEPAKDLKLTKQQKSDLRTVNEGGLGDLAQRAEMDHEVQMARADLYKIAKYAIKLHDMLKTVSEAEGIDGWKQSKITKAADYMGSVYHSMDYDMKFAESKQAKNVLKRSKSPTEVSYLEAMQSKVTRKLAESESLCSECGKPSYTTLDEEKQKGVDGKVCWKGYKRMGTKKKGGKTVDNCVKM